MAEDLFQLRFCSEARAVPVEEVAVVADGGGGWWECAVAVVEHYELEERGAVEPPLSDGAVALTEVEAAAGPYRQCGGCCYCYCYYYYTVG